MKEMKNTKIICTIGPVSTNLEVIKEFVEAGMNVARLNFSHGDHEEQLERIKLIREVNELLGTNVAILLDTKGPEIRTHSFVGGEATIVKGSTINIHMNPIEGDANNFSITYPQLINDVKVGGRILVNDGELALLINEIDYENQIIRCVALGNAVLKNKRGINVPDIKLSMPYFSEKDKADIAFGCEQDVDFIAASFVRRKEDVLEIREFLKSRNREDIKIIAKIENREGVENLEEIIEVSDGVMVARGDLGVEIPIQDVPIIQSKIVRLCHQANKIVIIATQMLESMINNPRPTRAEVSDVANAVLEGADAIMLSGETAAGKYPIEAVRMMASIAKRMEKAIDYQKMLERAVEKGEQTITNTIALSVADIILKLDVSAIVAPTVSGYTARSISKFRPRVPILALTPVKKVVKTLALNWGVHAMHVDFAGSSDQVFEQAMKITKDVLGLKKGELVVITAGMPLRKVGSTNMIRIFEVD